MRKEDFKMNQRKFFSNKMRIFAVLLLLSLLFMVLLSDANPLHKCNEHRCLICALGEMRGLTIGFWVVWITVFSVMEIIRICSVLFVHSAVTPISLKSKMTN
jgi:hypothetical protein